MLYLFSSAFVQWKHSQEQYAIPWSVLCSSKTLLATMEWGPDSARWISIWRFSQMAVVCPLLFWYLVDHLVKCYFLFLIRWWIGEISKVKNKVMQLMFVRSLWLLVGEEIAGHSQSQVKHVGALCTPSSGCYRRSSCLSSWQSHTPQSVNSDTGIWPALAHTLQV